MQTKDWFDLKIDAQGRDVIAKADLMGITMAAFVRVAAVERAQELLEREARMARIRLSQRDFEALFSFPFIPDLIRQMELDGIEECICLILEPHS